MTKTDQPTATLRIDAEFEHLLPPLTAAEQQDLTESLEREGCRDPVLAWNNTVIDGHNRYKTCKRLGIAFNIKQITFTDRDDAIIWIIRNNFSRRNLTNHQRAELAIKLEPMIKAAAERRMKAGKSDPDQISGQGRTDRQLAEIAGVSHDTIHKTRVIRATLPPRELARVRAGEITVNRGYEMAREIQKQPAKPKVRSRPVHRESKPVKIKEDASAAKASESKFEKIFDDASRGFKEVLDLPKEKFSPEMVSALNRFLAVFERLLRKFKSP